MRFKIAVAFSGIMLAFILVLNAYPTSTVRKQMISATQQEMLMAAGRFSAALSAAPMLDTDSINAAAMVFDDAYERRALVLNKGGVVLYDSLKSSELLRKTLVFPEIMSALSGKDVFGCTYEKKAYIYRSASAIIKGDIVVGAVFLYDYDEESAKMITDMQRNIYKITVAVLIFGMLFLITFSFAMGKRISVLLNGVHAAAEGDYEYHIELAGADELHDIAHEFNDLTGKLQQNEEMRRRFVSDASHELKTPLASIKLLSDSIVQTPNISEHDMREFVTDIGDEIVRLTRITESLLSLNKLDAQPLVQPVSCELWSSVNKCAELLRATAAVRDVTIILPPKQDYFICGTADGLHHIIFNLMENAIKYNRDGGTVIIEIQKGNDETALFVRDTGIGVEGSEQSRIFERFYRVDKARSRETGGSGLGLSIVAQWVKKLNAHIEVTSEYGVGTQFGVHFRNSAEEQK